MKKKITLDERKKIQLEMLAEIHDFCTSHGIRYSLAYGTLIGAIRHKGFIPWDDDVDLMMPLPDMLRFKKEFESDKLKYCDIDTESHFGFDFSRISYQPTYRKVGMINKTYGVNIDLYPIVNLPESVAAQNVFFEKYQKLEDKRHRYIKWRYRFIKLFPINSIWGYDKAIKRVRDFSLFNSLEYGSTSFYYVVSGPISEKGGCIYRYDLFKELVPVKFEGLTLSAVSSYDDFLRHYYGDYMQLPPESERHPYHSDNYFWR